MIKAFRNFFWTKKDIANIGERLILVPNGVLVANNFLEIQAYMLQVQTF